MKVGSLRGRMVESSWGMEGAFLGTYSATAEIAFKPDLTIVAVSITEDMSNDGGSKEMKVGRLEIERSLIRHYSQFASKLSQ